MPGNFRRTKTHTSSSSDAETEWRQQLAALQTELDVQRIECEVRSEELRSAQLQAELMKPYCELFHSAPAAQLCVDARGEIVRANAAACSLLGLAQSRIVGQSLGRFVPAQSWGALTELLDAVRHGPSTANEVSFMRRDGSELAVRVDARRTSSRAIEYLISLSELEPDRREAGDDARAPGDSRQKATHLASLGLRAAGIAHDLNNLLAGVIGSAELVLRMPDLCPTLREPLTTISRTARDAVELTAGVLGEGKSDNAVELAPVIADCLALARSRSRATLRLAGDLASDLPRVALARAQLQRVLMNLLTNAVEAIGDRAGTVVVSARVTTLDRNALSDFCPAVGVAPGPCALIEVSDDGHGMDAETLAHLFEPFVSTKPHGHGLGLASALAVVARCGGAIRVESCVGRGTRFDIALPLAAARPLPNPSAPATREVPASASVTLLMVDDDPTMCSVVARALGHLGFEVRCSQDGEQALGLLARPEAHYDGVLLDWTMPKMPGRTVLSELRRLHPTLPVLVMSGHKAERLPPEAEPVTWLQKPVSLDNLERALRKAVRSAALRSAS